MQLDWFKQAPLIMFILLSLTLLAAVTSRGRLRVSGGFRYLWAFFTAIAAAQFSFVLAVWILALISFRALREYFSLVSMRLADRWGILAAFLSIPFMFYLIQIDWYGFFIISIPVYAFLVIPFLVTAGGGDYKGCVLSIGAIDFGLFLLVYCLGHLTYLLYFSTWMTIFLILACAAGGLILRIFKGRGILLKYLMTAFCTTILALLLGPLTTIPTGHSLVLGLLLPVLMMMGDFTIGVVERDLGIAGEDLEPGRGRVLDSLRPYLYAAPVAFHYLRWVLKFGE